MFVHGWSLVADSYIFHTPPLPLPCWCHLSPGGGKPITESGLISSSATAATWGEKEGRKEGRAKLLHPRKSSRQFAARHYRQQEMPEMLHIEMERAKGARGADRGEVDQTASSSCVCTCTLALASSLRKIAVMASVDFNFVHHMNEWSE